MADQFEFAWGREFKHFSHSHILELTSLQGQGIRNDKWCRGCMKPIENFMAYHCQPCNFFLHLTCSQIPQQITHPADKHPLHLLSQPCNYGPSGYTRCNACWEPIIQGHFFNCSNCDLDLHPSCANLPTKIKDPNHDHHNSLNLCFIPPYPSKAFTCNACNKGGQSSWSYHCSECNYDSHVNCTRTHSHRQSLLNLACSDRPHLERSFNQPPTMSNSPRPSLLYNSSPFQMRYHPSLQQQHYQPLQQQHYHPLQQQYHPSQNHHLLQQQHYHPLQQMQPYHPLQQQYHPLQQMQPYHPLQQQQHYHPVQNMSSMVGGTAITAILRALFGSVVQSFMNPGEGGGGFSGGFDNSDGLSDSMGSMFNFGFF